MHVCLILAIAPGALIFWWLMVRDRDDPEPPGLVWGTVGLGALSSVWAVALEILADRAGAGAHVPPGETMPLGAALIAASFVGLAEESGKLLAVLVLPFRRKEFNQLFDGVVYCVAASLGFATLENILYVGMSGLAQGPFGAALTGGMRAVTAVPGHAGYGALMGLWVGAAKMVPKKRTRYLLTGFAVAAAAHALYDAVLFTRTWTGFLIIPILIAIVVWSLLGIKGVKEKDLAYARGFWGWRRRVDEAAERLRTSPRPDGPENGP
jgi:RsiW-degrading membrane proteinase PrsW (M82 family)